MDTQTDGYTEGEENLVFHHKRGEYRQREAQVYRDRATGKNQPKKGLFRALVSTRGNRIMFFTMLMCFALVLLVSLLTDNPDECTMQGIHCQLTAFSMEDRVYASVEVSPEKKGARVDEKNIHCVFIFYDNEGQGIYREGQDFVYDSSCTDPFIRCAYTDFNIIQVECVVMVDHAVSASIKAKVQKH